MTKAQLRDKLDCQFARCRFLHRCAPHWGKRCTRQGGKKVPRIKVGTYNGIDTIRYADIVTLKS